ncbi:MAG: DNA-binding domain-containing protein [Chloroherpetonaceae bacterium]|nr:DNA-binding domain-containing protein [Chloroherpetonaceae bacterium]
MPVKYNLQFNHVSRKRKEFIARVRPNHVYNTEKIIREMKSYGTMVSEADAKAVLDLFFHVVTEVVADGNFVNLPLVNIRVGVSGVFDRSTDRFNAKRHKVKATLSAGKLLYSKMETLTAEKESQAPAAPEILEFLDIASESQNQILTPKEIGKIRGKRLKFDPKNAEEGIFFISESNTETKATTVATRTESKLIFQIPALKPGKYWLEVRRAYTKAKAIRTGTMVKPLQVLLPNNLP